MHHVRLMCEFQKNIILIMLFFCLSSIGMAQADKNNLEKDNELRSDITEIFVEASRSNTKLESMPLYTTIITQEEIEKNPSLTLDQLLRNISSVNLSGAPYFVSDPTGTSLKMRGLANAKVLVMLDGIPIHDPFYSTIQWFKVPLSSIEKIEVVRGGGSALWGNLAVAGVINIISKQPSGDGGEINASLGNMNSQNFYVAKNIQISEDFKLRLSFDYMNTDGYVPTPTFFNGLYKLSAGQTSNSDNQANFRIDSIYRLSQQTTGFIKLGYHQQNQFINNELGQNLQQAYDLSAGLHSDISNVSNVDVKVWYQSILFNKNNATGCWPGSSASGVYVPSSPTDGKSCRTAFNVGVAPSDTETIYKYVSQTDYQPYTELGTSLVYTNKNSIGDSSIGFDSRRISASDTQFNYNAPNISNGLVISSPILNTAITSHATQQFIGLFYQQKYRPVDEFEGTLGLRVDSWKNSNADISINNVLNSQEDKTTYSFNPSLSFKYFLNDDFSLRSSIYKGFRAPGMNNMYRSFGSTSGNSTPSISNPDLQPENLYGWEIGSDYQSNLFDVHLTYYSLYVQNMNYSMALSSSSTGVAAGYYNSIKSLYGISASSFNYYLDQFDSRSNGIELGSKWYINNDIKILASYTYTNAYLTNTIDPAKNPAFQQLGGVSPNVGILGVDWNISSKLKTYWQARAVSQAYLDTAQTIQMPGYVTVDFSLAYEADPKTTLTVNGLNVFNQTYFTDGGSSSTTPIIGIPRLVMMGLRYKF